MTSEKRERDVGTLIVVVLKANHLPNKRNIGKQDPYCVCIHNGNKLRTKAIKRGGQHPEWDDELRFELKESIDEPSEGAPPPPPKNGDAKSSSKYKNMLGGMVMKLACYADDPREPDLIGEGEVDLTEVLTKGECDEWFTLTHKDRFAGKVYLELTFWSSEPPPEKKPVVQTQRSDPEYGGRGHFVASGGAPSSLQNIGQPRVASTSALYDHSRHPSDSTQSNMRASSSLAQIDLYNPPYERRGRISAIDAVTSDFAEFGVGDRHRRESFPPTRQQHSSGTVSSGFSSQNNRYEPPPSERYPYDRPVTPTNQNIMPQHHRHTVSGSYPYQPSFDQGTASGYQPPAAAPSRGPRYSIPTSSSGFMPLQSSGFAPIPSHASEPSGFGQSHTPAPLYNPSHFTQSGFPPPSQTPMPGFPPTSQTPMPGYAAPSSFAPAPLTHQQGYQYSQYAPAPTSQPYHTDQTPPPQQHQFTSYGSNDIPSHENTPSPSRSSSLPAGYGVGSRPLPLPQQSQFYGQPQPAYGIPEQQQQPLYGIPEQQHAYGLPEQQQQPVYGLPEQQQPVYGLPEQQQPAYHEQQQPTYHEQQQITYHEQQQPTYISEQHTGYAPVNGYQSIPPPPPLPVQPHSPHHQPSYSPNPSHDNIALNPVPPPPPQFSSHSPRRQTSLPPVPIASHGSSVFSQPLPPPPPPPIDYLQNPPPPPPSLPAGSFPYHPGPPPKPPVPMNDGNWQQQNWAH